MKTQESPMVFIVDDDLRVREAFCSLLTSAGYCVVAFATATEFLESSKPDCPSCLILDLELPDINGLAVQKQIREGHGPPIIFITGHGDIPTSVRAIKSGAIEFLLKPVKKDTLFPVVEEALMRDRAAREARFQQSELRKRYAKLTPREREVLPFVVSGFANKNTAAELGNSGFTIGIQRGQVMRKMGAQSLAELIRMADRLGIHALDRNC